MKNVRHIKRHVNIAQLTKTELGNLYLVSHPGYYFTKKVNKKNIEILSLDIVTGVIIKHGPHHPTKRLLCGLEGVICKEMS